MRRLLLAGFLVGCLSVPAYGQDFVRAVSYAGVEQRVSSFSGKPVPRFESLRYASVNGRSGPSLDYPIVWRYERSGLPVLVLKETHEWIKVRDPQGDEVWMHKRMLGDRHSVFIRTGKPESLYQSANGESRVLAQIEPGVIADLIECNGAWCRIAAQGRKGWVRHTALWGAPGPLPQQM